MGASRKSIVVTDLGYGDAGKGTIVDYLVRRHNAALVVRYNGGCQAAHNVVTPDGRHHTFQQFSSGTFVGARTHLSEYFILEPLMLLDEALQLASKGVVDPLSRLSIHSRAKVTTPIHQAANWLRELARGDHRHGSVGLGIGEVMQSYEVDGAALYAKDLSDPGAVKYMLRVLQEHKRCEFREQLKQAERSNDELQRRIVKLLSTDAWFDNFANRYGELASYVNIVDDEAERDLMRLPATVVYEGAQGTLLDQHAGFFPYVTRSYTTSRNARLLDIDCRPGAELKVIGVVRAYSTRHGPGPFPTESELLTRVLQEPHNKDGRWMGGFRAGWFDVVATRFAVAANNGVDELAVTCLDRMTEIEQLWPIATGYQPRGDVPEVTALQVPSVCATLDDRIPITNMLSSCTAVKTAHYSHDPDLYVDELERRVGVPVTITSFGRTANDKRERLQKI